MMAEKNSRICAEKKNSTECPFWAVSAHRTTVLAQFWLFPPTGPLWIMNMDHCVLENRKNNFLEPFLGPKILLQGQQVGTPTLPTAIPLKSSSSMRATLVFNLFLNETMLVFNP
jgi:hypothetical protein